MPWLHARNVSGCVPAPPGELVYPDNFDRHIPFQERVESLVYRSHPALAQLFEDVIATKEIDR